ncbi:hypothetical protein NSU_0510 [Novosphingobium pentaromativorans US6-1]|uniref:Uncharacterized protein n=1 Tax=Novosphingobium pentaromativorans US6-1 TaxID=1088721 RepID=G6E839_9SPHN|nr:hypothetical protein NSU_0510 [Novosphingobium pentaromativorans US6-1]
MKVDVRAARETIRPMTARQGNPIDETALMVSGYGAPAFKRIARCSFAWPGKRAASGSRLPIVIHAHQGRFA